MKKKKFKINKKKFIPRIALIIGIILVFILIIKVATKKETKAEVSQKPILIVDTENVTDNLKHDIIINNGKKLYMSTDDIKNIFDSNLYYEKDSNKIITTYGTKTAAIDINNNTMEVNSANLILDSTVMKINNLIYLPLSELLLTFLLGFFQPYLV